jgi:molecular chaperone HscB
MEVMDAREELHEASSVAEVDALAKFAREDLEKGLVDLRRLFLANDRGAIKKALLRLRYLDKFAEEARARRTNLERSKK